MRGTTHRTQHAVAATLAGTMPSYRELAQRKREVAEEIRRLGRTLSLHADQAKAFAQADALEV